MLSSRAGSASGWPDTYGLGLGGSLRASSPSAGSAASEPLEPDRRASLLVLLISGEGFCLVDWSASMLRLLSGREAFDRGGEERGITRAGPAEGAVPFA